jgi:hypothetical protein
VNLCGFSEHKSVAGEKMRSARRVYFINAAEKLTARCQSEEHLVLEAGANHPYQVGDVLIRMPISYMFQTVALYERACSP